MYQNTKKVCNMMKLRICLNLNLNIFTKNL